MVSALQSPRPLRSAGVRADAADSDSSSRKPSARSGRRTLDSRWRRRSNSPRCIGIAVVPAWVERAGCCSGYGVTACVGEELNTLGLAGYAVRFVSCTDVHCEVASRRRATVHLGAGARCTAAPVPLSSLACEHCSHGQGDKDSEPWHLLSPPASWGLSSRLLQLSIGQTLALQALGLQGLRFWFLAATRRAQVYKAVSRSSEASSNFRDLPLLRATRWDRTTSIRTPTSAR